MKHLDNFVSFNESASNVNVTTDMIIQAVGILAIGAEEDKIMGIPQYIFNQASIFRPILLNILNRRGVTPKQLEQVSPLLNEVLNLHNRAGMLKPKGWDKFKAFFGGKKFRTVPDQSVVFAIKEYQKRGEENLQNEPNFNFDVIRRGSPIELPFKFGRTK